MGFQPLLKNVHVPECHCKYKSQKEIWNNQMTLFLQARLSICFFLKKHWSTIHIIRESGFQEMSITDDYIVNPNALDIFMFRDVNHNDKHLKDQNDATFNSKFEHL